VNIEILALQAASLAFAIEEIPDDWYELSMEDQKEWLEENRCESFENISNEEFYKLIYNQAGNIKLAINEVLKLLKGKLVEDAIE
jgi:hypothetical protein